MNITLDSSLDKIDWNEVSALFDLVGWGKRDTEKLRQAFSASSLVFAARVDGALAGFGRAMTDGQFYATLFDVIVKPEFQGMGIGTLIIKKLLSNLEGLRFVHLTAMPGKEGFYRRFGFEKQKTAMVLMDDPDSPLAARILERDTVQE
jgi:ribosomal protein S18 acetylase RimI-like enzyme